MLKRNIDFSTPTKSNFHDDFLLSAKTAIYRAGITAPLKCILEHGLIEGYSSILHFAKGRAEPDSKALAKFGQVSDHDYTFCPNPEALGHFHDYVVANYCLNVLPFDARHFALNQIANCTRGIAFLSVRTDKVDGIQEGDGIRNRGGSKTFQRSYRPGELVTECLEYFEFVTEIKSLKNQSGFAIVACSNKKIPENIARAAKKIRPSKRISGQLIQLPLR